MQKELKVRTSRQERAEAQSKFIPEPFKFILKDTKNSDPQELRDRFFQNRFWKLSTYVVQQEFREMNSIPRR